MSDLSLPLPAIERSVSIHGILRVASDVSLPLEAFACAECKRPLELSQIIIADDPFPYGVQVAGCDDCDSQHIIMATLADADPTASHDILTDLLDTCLEAAKATVSEELH